MQLKQMMQRCCCLSAQGGVVGMVLDLTNSDKYYDPGEFTNRNVRYCKVRAAVVACCDQAMSLSPRAASGNRVLGEDSSKGEY